LRGMTPCAGWLEYASCMPAAPCERSRTAPFPTKPLPPPSLLERSTSTSSASCSWQVRLAAMRSAFSMRSSQPPCALDGVCSRTSTPAFSGILSGFYLCVPPVHLKAAFCPDLSSQHASMHASKPSLGYSQHAARLLHFLTGGVLCFIAYGIDQSDPSNL
jgi:hypothetical protein